MPAITFQHIIEAEKTFDPHFEPAGGTARKLKRWKQEISIGRFFFPLYSPPQKNPTAQGKCIFFPNERDSSILQANLKHVLNWFWYSWCSFLLNSLSRIMAFRLMSPLRNSFLWYDAEFVLRARRSSNYIIRIFTELCYTHRYICIKCRLKNILGYKGHFAYYFFLI